MKATQKDIKKSVDPSHYKTASLETWDAIIQLDLGYLAGNVLKYICRYPYKGQKEADLLKARAYLEKLIEVELGSSGSNKKQ